MNINKRNPTKDQLLLVESLQVPLLLLNTDLEVLSANQSFLTSYGMSKKEVMGAPFFDLIGHWKVPQLDIALADLINKNKSFQNCVGTHLAPNFDSSIISFSGSRLQKNENVLLLCVTEQESNNDIRKYPGYEHLQEFFYQAPAAIAIVHGPHHVYSLCNARYETLFNRSKKQLIGKSIKEVFPEIEDQGVNELFDEVFRSGEAYIAQEYPIFFDRKGEGEVEEGFFNFIAHPIKDSTGTVTDIMIHAFEITEQVILKRKLEESEAHYRLIADLMPEKITNNDPDGKPIYYNQPWLDFTGLTSSELAAMSWDELIHADDLKKLISKWRYSLFTGEEYEAEYRVLNKYNQYIWQLTRGVPVKNDLGQIKMWITTSTDIHQLKEEEKRQQGFLRMVSHELRTPVTSIKGFVQLLLSLLESQGYEIPASLPIKSSLQRIDHQVNRLTQLISEILDLSRVEYNKLDLELERFSINELVIETVHDITQTNPHHEIKVTNNFACEIVADKNRLGQVLINILTNAMKYSPNGEEIIVIISKEESEQVVVRVIDKGIGIKRKDLKRIFERFYRSEKTNEDTYPGFGIGLFLAKEIIERHQGSITVESEVGKGSTFTVLLPCQ